MIIYQFQILKQIHACFAGGSSKDVYLRRDVELPFPPYPGLVLLVAGEEIALKEVFFDVGCKKFKVYTEEDNELYTMYPQSDARGIDEIAKEYVDAGWEIRK